MRAELQELFAAGRAMIRAALIALVKGYRLLLSPWLGSSCRFTPDLFGLFAAGARAPWRRGRHLPDAGAPGALPSLVRGRP